jgi:GTP cyclohydrolase II
MSPIRLASVSDPSPADRRVLLLLAKASLPTRFGTFEIVSFREANGNNLDEVALVRGHVEGSFNVPTRVHSECVTGDTFGSIRCDCRDQLELSLSRIAKSDCGLLLYLRQEGRGIGIAKKVAAYQLQDNGLDTVQANRKLGFAPDLRSYEVAAAMLQALGVGSIELHTNNPHKVQELQGYGVTVTARKSIIAPYRPENERYLDTKRTKCGHLL